MGKYIFRSLTSRITFPMSSLDSMRSPVYFDYIFSHQNIWIRPAFGLCQRLKCPAEQEADSNRRRTVGGSSKRVVRNISCQGCQACIFHDTDRSPESAGGHLASPLIFQDLGKGLAGQATEIT